MSKIIFPCLFFLLVVCASVAQTAPQVQVPQFNDKYSEFVKKLEAGDTGVNFKDFRESFIESQQFIVASKQKTSFDSLEKIMYKLMDKKKYQEIIKVTKEMLSIDYTSMRAHKVLQQTYRVLGDTVNRKKYHDIEFGLLNSIVRNGDGKTCETGWPVIQIEEEYFILDMLGAKLTTQSLITSGGLCDQMDVKIDGDKRTYYFEVTKVFEGYKKLGIK